MAAGMSPLRIDGPPPTPRPYGIVNTPGTIVEQSDPHYLGGVLVDPYPSDLPSLHAPCVTGTMRVKDEGTTLDEFPDFSSFTVVYPITCSGIGMGNEAGAQRLRDRARTAFAATESYAVEFELATGLVGVSGQPHFTDSDLTVLGAAGGVSPVEGIALLENAIGGTARQGMIHTDPGTFMSWASKGDLVSTDGRAAFTYRGTPVIIGDGYIGVSPGATLVGTDHGYAYATGPVRLSRDEIEVIGLTRESLDTTTNIVTFRAERNYIAYWDKALQVAVRIDRSLTP